MVADVVVLGLGSAGAAAATFFAQAGRKVVAVDKRAVGETGARWMNAVPRWCFEAARLAPPSGDCLFGGGAAEGHRFHLIAPEARGRLSIAAPPILHVDMRRLVDGLARDAIAAGAEVVRGAVTGVAIERGRVRSVTVASEGGSRELTASLFVDATGIGGAVRGRVPELAAACPMPDEHSRCVAAEYQFAVRDPEGLRAFLREHGAEPGHDLAFSGLAGGYSTVTLFTTRSLDLVGVLTGSIPSLGVPDAGALLDRFVERAPFLGEQLWGGRGAIPVRRPFDVLAAPGVALVGDAACQVHAAHGSGVGIGLVAARLLADATAHASDPGHRDALLRYERSFHAAYGGLLAAADAFRRFVQSASRGDVQSLIEEGLLEERLASAALAQHPVRPDIRFAMSMVPKVARAPGLALRFLPLAARSAVLDRLGTVGALPYVGRALGSVLLSRAVGRAPREAGHGPW